MRREVSAKVRGSATYHVDLSRVGDEIYVSCECAYFDSEPVCKHIWATILAADEKFYLLGVGGGPRGWHGILTHNESGG